MKVIKREMITIENETQETCYEHKACQASFNSDGNITLRNYDRCDKNKDEIIILSDYETRAIFDLFKRFNRQDVLPF